MLYHGRNHSNHQLSADLDADNGERTAQEWQLRDRFCRFCGAVEKSGVDLASTGYTHLRRIVQEPPVSTRAQAWAVPQFGHRFMMCGPCQVGYERHRWSVRDVQRFEGSN